MLLLNILNEPDCRFLFFEYLALSIFVYFGILSICITPNMPVAYMFSGTIYFSECCSWCRLVLCRWLMSTRLACAAVPAFCMVCMAFHDSFSQFSDSRLVQLSLPQCSA